MSTSTGNCGTVVDCYAAFDSFFPVLGFRDLTEGIYDRRGGTTFAEAQANKQRYLLDQVRCGPGTRLLDVGCGYGTLLERARGRGARVVGITLSPEQQAFCAAAGMEVHLLHYGDLGPGWVGAFDGVVASGSLEHFVQPNDAVEGLDDVIYSEFFELMRAMLDPVTNGRLVTTAIHFARRVDPQALLADPHTLTPGSDEYHFALLAQSFGGWYPKLGQLRRCALGNFELVEEVDGTEDYRRTSETWLASARGAMGSPRGIEIAMRAATAFISRPQHTANILNCVIGSESWNWQFRTSNPPTRLLRQTWQRIP